MSSERAQERLLKPVAKPEGKPPVPRTPAEAFGKRMFDFADLLLAADEKQRFGHLMQDIAEDFPRLSDAEYYDRVRSATDLLPMTKAQALAFAEKIRKHLVAEFGTATVDDQR